RTGPTTVEPSLQTAVRRIEADSEFVKRVAKSRSDQPESRQFLRAEARRKAVQMLRQEMDEQAETALADIRARFRAANESLQGFSDALAPVVREGAAPRFAGSESTPARIAYYVESGRAHQGGAPLPCPVGMVEGDVQIKVHVSAIENMAETIMAGKTFTDRYFMNYAQIFQAQLPTTLMVHSRAQRWSVEAARDRPLQLSFPARNQFKFRLEFAACDIDGRRFDGPLVMETTYELAADSWGDYALQRLTPVELVADLPTVEREFLRGKLAAFFGETLDGGGVVLPSGGILGTLQLLQSRGVRAEGEWFAAGIGVPDELIDRIVAQVSGEATASNDALPSDAQSAQTDDQRAAE
ncbi:MAG: hypothetical protein KDA61_01040, partial [Planctomycetales bacterium]|nr:hypothetical protein [Planctomycetales bacterium]